MKKVSKEVVVLRVPETASDRLKNSILKKEIENHPNLDPKGYFWMGNKLFHNGVNVLKKQKRLSVKVRDGGFTRQYEIDFLKEVVSKNNLNYEKQYIETSGKGVEWKPLIITNPKNDVDLEMFKNTFLISKDGMIAQYDPDDIGSYILKTPYWHGYGFSISLSVPGATYRNQTIKNLVRNAWGEDASAFIQEQEEYIKAHPSEFQKKAA